jgi:16S rRNA U516 pseudouridylate synthase RsuA-like enzyme
MGMLFCLQSKSSGGTRRSRTEGRALEDEQRAGRPSTARTENNVARVKVVLDRDRRLQVRLIADEVGLPKTDVHRIIAEDLHMRKICAFTTTMHQVTHHLL